MSGSGPEVCIGDQSDMGMSVGGRVFQHLFLLLLFQAVTLWHLLLLEFGVIILALDSTNLVGLSGLGSIPHMALIPQEDHSLWDFIYSGIFHLPRGILSLHNHLCNYVHGW